MSNEKITNNFLTFSNLLSFVVHEPRWKRDQLPLNRRYNLFCHVHDCSSWWDITENSLCIINLKQNRRCWSSFSIFSGKWIIQSTVDLREFWRLLMVRLSAAVSNNLSTLLVNKYLNCVSNPSWIYIWSMRSVLIVVTLERVDSSSHRDLPCGLWKSLLRIESPLRSDDAWCTEQ